MEEITIEQLEEDLAKMDCYNQFYEEKRKDDELYEENLKYQKRLIKYMKHIYDEMKKNKEFMLKLNK